MNKIVYLTGIFLTLNLATVTLAVPLHSPDGKLEVDFSLNANGAPRYEIRRDGQCILQESSLGLVRNDADFTTALKPAGSSAVELVEDRYEILTAKRRINEYRANRRVFHLANRDGKKIDIIFQVSNDGVAFRYVFPETPSTQGDTFEITEEVSSFHFLPETRAWLQAMQVAKTGWKGTNPAYEEFYQKDIPVGTPSPLGQGWVYPALFRSGETWLLVSESSLDRGTCGTRLRHESPDGEYRIGFPDTRETMNGESIYPAGTLPLKTPWRLIVVGDLKTVTESTLGIDLSTPAAVEVNGPILPGQASWSWPLLGDGKTIFPVQKEFIDYAADMGWEYCLIDADWHKRIGYEKIEELVRYADDKNVGILLWYNSAGDWNTVGYGPKSKLLTHESRMEEFSRLKEIGIKGLKIDFFGGDGRAVIDYYHDILEDSAQFGFLINFHGATLPRGWQRTYPNLMTVEAIRGLESFTFEQKNADQAATHSAMLPFTRNVFDPMDFTPMVLDKLPGNKQRRTTSAFELALSVLFTSGIQHYAEIPSGMAKAPDYVREFLRNQPNYWDDTVFLDGFPGQYVALARKGEDRWYICGINAESTDKTLELNLSELSLPPQAKGQLITDGDGGNLSFVQKSLDLDTDQTLHLPLKPKGGFVLVFED